MSFDKSYTKSDHYNRRFSNQTVCQQCLKTNRILFTFYDKIYCQKCYYTHYANYCDNCDKVITYSTKAVMAFGYYYHPECFNCNLCKKQLPSQDECFSYEKKYYCFQCAYQKKMYIFNCAKCDYPIFVGLKRVTFNQKAFHEKCLRCHRCKKRLEPKNVRTGSLNYYCEECYSKIHTNRCAYCKQLINSNECKLDVYSFHRDCFACTKCGRKLAMSRAINYKKHPLCLNCYNNLRANGESKLITNNSKVCLSKSKSIR